MNDPIGACHLCLNTECLWHEGCISNPVRPLGRAHISACVLEFMSFFIMTQ